jgi:hypothetical protein
MNKIVRTAAMLALSFSVLSSSSAFAGTTGAASSTGAVTPNVVSDMSVASTADLSTANQAGAILRNRLDALSLQGAPATTASEDEKPFQTAWCGWGMHPFYGYGFWCF